MIVKDIRKKKILKSKLALRARRQPLVMGYVIRCDEEIISDGRRCMCWINISVLQLETSNLHPCFK